MKWLVTARLPFAASLISSLSPQRQKPLKADPGKSGGFGTLIKKGLLGYQPIFFPNGLISGTGLQFFGNLRKTYAQLHPGAVTDAAMPESRSIQVNASDTFNQGRLGNLYVPAHIGDRAEFNTEFYYCVEDDDLEDFVHDNLVLLEMYEYFAATALKLCREKAGAIDSMIEIGSNTCLFPFAFAKDGVKSCHGADIVDYSDVVGVLSEIHKASVTFHHMPDDSDETWRKLPKADLVWSYAVLLHQSNPLTHLTRLASLAKKAMFVMTLCEPEDWKSADDMAIRYLSANSYYNADFPNCFDVTMVSPALLKYSLNRLGFSQIVEIPHPDLKLLDEAGKTQLGEWMKKHCFYLALRDAPRGERSLNDYSVSAERSPYKGENVLVYEGNHHNIVLSHSKYFIVPHGEFFDGTDSGANLQSFASLTNAMACLNGLATEITPVPIQIRALARHNLIRYKKRFYLCAHGQSVDFAVPENVHRLHSFDSLGKWDRLLETIDEADIQNIDGVVVDSIGDFLIVRAGAGGFAAKPIGQVSQPGPQEAVQGSSVQGIVQKIRASQLIEEILQFGEKPSEALLASGGVSLHRVGLDRFQLKRTGTGEIISTHSSIEEALKNMVSTSTQDLLIR